MNVSYFLEKILSVLWIFFFFKMICKEKSDLFLKISQKGFWKKKIHTHEINLF